MKDELKQKLLKEIDKSGFPLELSVIEKLRNVDLTVFPNFNFADSAGKLHEIDAFAMMDDLMLHDEDEQTWPYGTIGLNIFIECKSSTERPWVFFREANDVVASTLGLVDRLAYVTDIAVNNPYLLLRGCFNTVLKNHHYNADLPIARTYFEAFGKDAGREIYQGVTSIWHVLDFYRKRFGTAGRGTLEQERKRTFFMHGVIVYKGVLVVASKEGDDFQLAEVPHVILRTTDCLTNSSYLFSPNHETLIDVVHEDYFDQYVSICREDLRLCIEHLLRLAKYGWLTDSMDVNSPISTE